MSRFSNFTLVINNPLENFSNIMTALNLPEFNYIQMMKQIIFMLVGFKNGAFTKSGLINHQIGD